MMLRPPHGNGNDSRAQLLPHHAPCVDSVVPTLETRAAAATAGFETG